MLACGHATFKFGHRGDIPNAEKPYYLGRHLAARGYEVTLVYENPFGRKMHSRICNGLEIVFLPRLSLSPYANQFNPLTKTVLGALEQVLHGILQPLISLSREPDVVHSFWPGWVENFIPLLMAQHVTKARTVIDLEDRIGGEEGYVNTFQEGYFKHLKKFWFTLLENKSARLTDAAICSTDLMCALLHSLGVEHRSIYKIPRGVDTCLYRPMEKGRARAALGLDSKSKIVGYLGGSLRIPAYHEILLKAFSRVVRAWPTSKIILIGRRIPDSARATVSRLGLEESVITTKDLGLEEIPIYFAATDALLLPLLDNFVDASRWPNRLLEYMSCGKPVVVSSVGEARKIVKNQKCGLIAEAGQPDNFADMINYLFDHTAEATEMGLRSRAAVERSYTWQSVTDATERVYQTLVK